MPKVHHGMDPLGIFGMPNVVLRSPANILGLVLVQLNFRAGVSPSGPGCCAARRATGQTGVSPLSGSHPSRNTTWPTAPAELTAARIQVNTRGPLLRGSGSDRCGSTVAPFAFARCHAGRGAAAAQVIAVGFASLRRPPWWQLVRQTVPPRSPQLRPRQG